MTEIRKIEVTYEDGSKQAFTGEDGHVKFMEIRSSGSSKQAPGKLMGVQIQAYITQPK